MSPVFSVGDTVRCIHDEAKCGLGTACGYYRTVGVLGTILEVNTGRSRTPGEDWVAHVHVAYIGHDRPSIHPIDQIEAVEMSHEQMLDEWQSDLDRVSAHGVRTNKYYDEAPDGSPQKSRAVETIDYLSHRRSLIERAQTVLVDLIVP